MIAKKAFAFTAVTLIIGLVAAGPAAAGTYDDLTGNPGQECRPTSMPDRAGSGFPGLVDPAPDQPGSPERIYATYGWAGYSWEVCATGGPLKGAEALGNLTAWNDTNIGTGLLKTATGIAALNSGVAQMAATPGVIMAPLDEIVLSLSSTVRNALVDTWLPLLLLGAATIVLAAAITHNVRRVSATVLSIIVALFGIAYLSALPLGAARLMDGMASSAQAAVLEKAQQSAGKGEVPAAQVWGTIYTEQIIFPLWASGLTGWDSKDSRLRPNLQGERLGPISSTQKFDKFTPTQAYQLRAYPWRAERDEKTDKARRDAWNTIGEASQTQDAPTRAFAGHEQNRTGNGLMALLAVSSSAAFNIPANLMIFLASVAFRLLPIVGLVALLTLVFDPIRAFGLTVGRWFLSVMVNGVILGIFAAIQLAIVATLFSSTLGFLWASVASSIITIVLYRITKPVRSLTSTVTSPVRKTAKKLTQRLRSERSHQHASKSATTSSPSKPTSKPPAKEASVIPAAPLKPAATSPTAASAPAQQAERKPDPHKTRPSGSHTRTPSIRRANTPIASRPPTPAASARRAYSSLAAARHNPQGRGRRMFIPPEKRTGPSKPVSEPQRGDRPPQRRFEPPPISDPPGSEPVKPLKKPQGGSR